MVKSSVCTYLPGASLDCSISLWIYTRSMGASTFLPFASASAGLPADSCFSQRLFVSATPLSALPGMADSKEKLLTKLATLNASLDDLEDKLEPILSQTLPESLLPLETIQQAKLNVALPYLAYDLVFIYLKTRGIDPKTHPVVAELDRVRQYFDKIKNAEDPEKRKTAVDKAAANRFIKHAIAQAKEDIQNPSAPSSSSSAARHIRFDEHGNAPSSSSTPSVAGPSRPKPSGPPLAASIPVKVTAKMRAREEWQRKLAAGDDADAEMGVDAEGGDDADVLQVFDEEDEGQGSDSDSDAEDAEPPTASQKSKGKGRAKANDKGKGRSNPAEEQSARAAAGGKKRRRAAVDPFAGYGDETESKSAKTPQKKKPSPPRPEGEDADVAMDGDSGSGNATPKSGKKEKKAKRKARKASSG
ncbi:Sas10/Utp3/C1D family-domain-containing protein [Daedaleopsis nitida]|nr:Sas10/Utp3/C1D family-domain-containing protein [Daedaleopsis nitida]